VPLLSNQLRAATRAALSPEALAVLRAARQWLFCCGWRYQCLFCGGRFRRLLPYGSSLPVLEERQVVGHRRRDNVRCPKCRSLDRDRLLLLFLRHRTDVFRGRRMHLLHLAPEVPLRDRLAVLDSLDYVTADISRADVDVALDLTNAPLQSCAFDLAICCHVLEHIPDDRRAMAELHRLLRPGGAAILQVPLSLNAPSTLEDPTISEPEDRERLFGQLDHVRIYSLDDYRSRLESVGFHVEVFRWTTDHRFLPRDNRYALDRREPLVCATRPRTAVKCAPTCSTVA